MALYSLVFHVVDARPQLNVTPTFFKNQLSVSSIVENGYVNLTRLDVDSTPSSTLILKLKSSISGIIDVQFGGRRAEVYDIRPIEDLKIQAEISCGKRQFSRASTIVPALSNTAFLTFDKNIESFQPVFVGEINGNILNVTSISSGEIVVGNALTSDSLLAAGTVVTGYLGGNGGVGTYTVNISQTRAPAVYRGTKTPITTRINLDSNNSLVFQASTRVITDYDSFGRPSRTTDIPIVLPFEQLFEGVIQEPTYNFLDSKSSVSVATARASIGIVVPTFLASELSSSGRVANSRLSIINSAQVAGLTAEADDNVITGTGHGFDIGEPIIFVSLTGGVGLTENVVYWVIASGFTANTFRVSTSFGGSQVDITTDYADMVAESRLREVLFSFRGSATATVAGQIQGGVLLSVQAASSVLSSGSLNYDYAISSQITATSTSETTLGVVAPTLIRSESQIIVTGYGNLLVEKRNSGILLFVDVATRKIVNSPIFLRPITEIPLTRNDIAAIDIQFVKNNQIVKLTHGSTGRVGIKSNFSEELLAIDSSWSEVDIEGVAAYQFSLNLGTAEIDDLFNNEEAFVNTKFEIEWEEADTVNTTSPCTSILYNSVLL